MLPRRLFWNRTEHSTRSWVNWYDRVYSKNGGFSQKVDCVKSHLKCHCTTFAINIFRCPCVIFMMWIQTCCVYSAFYSGWERAYCCWANCYFVSRVAWVLLHSLFSYSIYRWLCCKPVCCLTCLFSVTTVLILNMLRCRVWWSKVAFMPSKLAFWISLSWESALSYSAIRMLSCFFYF